MNSQNYDLILASQSPRRRQLLNENGYVFEVRPPADSVEKGICSKCSPEDLVIESAFVKGRAVAQTVESGVVLSADTVAECRAEILGKPVDQDHAEKMLRLVSGNVHRVLTGVCLWHRPSDKYIIRVEQTVLKMDELSEDKLETILESDTWVGKAGAFGYQDGLDWVHIQAGLESNVVGLPVERLAGWVDELMEEVAKAQ
ncbi:MAG: nucleoside triphosphate pyrophosphatase [Mariniblastus sp.]